MKEAGSDPFAPIALTADGKRMTNSSDKKTD